MLRSIRTSMLAFAVIGCSTGAAKEVAQHTATTDSLPTGDSASGVSLPRTESSTPVHVARRERSPAASPASPASPAKHESSSARTLAGGTRIDATIRDTLSSRVNHSGDAVRAIIGADIKDAQGRLVVPAGSMATLTIDHIDPGNDHGQPDGRLSLIVTSVTIDGKIFPVSARLDPVAHRMVGRGITKDEAERIAAGTAIGAVAGQIIGKNTKSTVIGGAAGAVVGTAVAVRYAYRDVVVPAGTPIAFTLTEALVASR